MNLINRHHPTRWSLEQNQPVQDNSSAEKLPRRRINRNSFFKILAIFLLLALMTFYFLWNTSSLSSEEEILLEAATGSIMVQEHRENEAHGVLLPVEAPSVAIKGDKNQKYAFVTLVCDNEGLPNARVLAYALKRVKTAFSLLVMTLPNVTEGLDDLIILGATIEKIAMVPVPFRRPNGKRISYQKACKYSKIQAWSLTNYTKLVFLDSSLLVVNVPFPFSYQSSSLLEH